MRHLLLLPLMFGAIVACSASCGVSTTPTGTSTDPNSPVAHAVDTITNVLFTAEQPAVNAAVATLPPDAQALAQAAYVALQEAVKAGEAALLSRVASDANGTVAQTVSTDLAYIAKILSETIHDPTVPKTLVAP